VFPVILLLRVIGIGGHGQSVRIRHCLRRALHSNR
jgi:hypothetical protein